MKTHLPARTAKLQVGTEHTLEVTRTLAIDIGGTGLKMLVLGHRGQVLVDRVRVETPRPARPSAVLRALWSPMEAMGTFDRVSVGFPGVVIDGVVKTAPNLHRAWVDFPLGSKLAESTRKPVRVLNDAGVQGYGVVEGRGVEMLLTFGTGMGCAVFMNGVYVPNLELAHHPIGHRKGTYEHYVGAKALEKVGRKKWSHRVGRVIEQVLPIWNPRVLYLGGGNAKHLDLALPGNVKIVPNVAGLLGGIALWRDRKSVV